MSAITAALRQLDDVAAEGDLAPDPLHADTLALEPPSDPILLPDGKRIYPPTWHGERVDALALALLDMDDPARSSFLRLVGPPGAGKEPDRPSDRLPAVGRARPRGRGPPRRAVLRLRGDAARAELGRVFFRHEWVPVAGSGGQGLAPGLGVRAGHARGLGGDDRRGQHGTRRVPALDQCHPRRPPRALPLGDRRDRHRPAGLRRDPRVPISPPTGASLSDCMVAVAQRVGCLCRSLNVESIEPRGPRRRSRRSVR
jgi:hypothetical protein